MKRDELLVKEYNLKVSAGLVLDLCDNETVVFVKAQPNGLYRVVTESPCGNSDENFSCCNVEEEYTDVKL